MFCRILPGILFVLTSPFPMLEAAAGPAPGRLLGKFQLEVIHPSGGPRLPLRSVNRLDRGFRLRYQPGSMNKDSRKKGEIALVLVPAASETGEKLQVLDPRPLGKPCEWVVPYRVSVISIVFGPSGLDEKKIDKLLERNDELVPMLAEYAEQTGQWEDLLDVLGNWEQTSTDSREDLHAVLSGFAARNGLPTPRLDSSAPPEEQAALMLRTLVPALSSYDPLTSERTVAIQQSTGLVASVAGLFFGTPVGLAAGGAALFQNFRTLFFPRCEFRSALAQGPTTDDLALYAKPEPPKSRTRLAYLWAAKIPDQVAPTAAFVPSVVHVPLGLKSNIKIAGDKDDLRRLSRTRAWELIPSGGGKSIPVKVEFPSGLDSLQIDLENEHLSPGNYRLEGQWDWESFSVAGSLEIHALGDISRAAVSPASLDRLVEGSGVVTVRLEGADFQFLENVRLSRRDKPIELTFRLPSGKRGGVQNHVEVDIDTNLVKAGEHSLVLVQSGAQSSTIAIRVHPPHPTITNLPIRLNLGEAIQRYELQGTGLNRITDLRAEAGRWSLVAPVQEGNRRELSVEGLDGVAKGALLDLEMRVEDLQEPLILRGAVEIRGPRPRIIGIERSNPGEGTVALREGEIAIGTVVTYAVRTENVDSSPVVELRCGDKNQPFSLSPGEQRGHAKLDAAGDQILFLALDPAGVGEPGCRLTANVSTRTSGVSDSHLLGVVVKLPRIESFSLTNEAVGEGFYAGSLVGENLHLIEKVGWDNRQGYPVESIPMPFGGDFRKQKLRIVLPWPAPRPHAPVYVWLRGEQEARATRVGF